MCQRQQELAPWGGEAQHRGNKPSGSSRWQGLRRVMVLEWVVFDAAGPKAGLEAVAAAAAFNSRAASAVGVSQLQQWDRPQSILWADQQEQHCFGGNMIGPVREWTLQGKHDKRGGDRAQ
ncbi:hypothetical protein chiPu_0013969 [Chiloscyllium punctatum]|uniref:Uncharacterized protein n=1 Tax=Chiloscyllium punctatum TaxID=137246 RepID=A0A401SYL0_CHIPU|nr:hypothetical protein [Chiloscyllium punctatum]